MGRIEDPDPALSGRGRPGQGARNDVAASRGERFGDLLRHERESRGTSLEEIVRQTGFDAAYLEALEANDVDALPGTAIGKFYIRAYASLVGFDPAPLLEEYERELYRRGRERIARKRGASAAAPRPKPKRRAWLEEEADLAADAGADPAEPAAPRTVDAPAAEPQPRAETRPEQPVGVLTPAPTEPTAPAAAAAERAAKPETEVEARVAAPTSAASHEPRAVAGTIERVAARAESGSVGPAASPSLPSRQPVRRAVAPVLIVRHRALVALAALVALLVVILVVVVLSSSRVPQPETSAAPPPPRPIATAPIPGEAPPSVADSPDAPEVVAALPEPRPAPEVRARLRVEEFGVGRRIVDRNLAGRTDRFEVGSVAWFWTRVRDGRPGDRVSHLWLHEGRAIQSVELEVGSASWRTHSRKTLRATGRWTVQVRDAEGRILAEAGFRCVPAGAG